MPVDEKRKKLIQQILGDPELFPDSFKSWLSGHVQRDPNIIWERSQIPILPYDKLNLGGGIVDSDIAANAAMALSKLAAPAYTTYTPAWTSSGTAPALGNGTLTGRYSQIGKRVHCVMALAAGSTTTYGTGSWALSLPVTADTTLQHNGQAMCFDNSAGAFYSCFAHSVFGSGTTVNVYTGAQPAVVVGLGVPFAWATSDILQIDFLYEAA